MCFVNQVSDIAATSTLLFKTSVVSMSTALLFARLVAFKDKTVGGPLSHVLSTFGTNSGAEGSSLLSDG